MQCGKVTLCITGIMEGGSSTVDAKGPAKLTPEEQKKVAFFPTMAG